MSKNSLEFKISTRKLWITSSLWISYTILYYFLKINQLNTFVGYFAFLGQVGLDIALTVITYKLFRKSADLKTEKIYLMFLTSFVSAGFADGIYNFGMNVVNVEHFYNINSFFEIPFIVFLLLQLMAWWLILNNFHEKVGRKNIWLYFPYILASSTLFVIFIFGIHWEIERLSLMGVYQIIDTIIEVITFSVVTICLTRAKNTALVLASMGYLIIISSDLLIRNEVVSGVVPNLNPFETTWVLGLLMLMIGFISGEKDPFKLLSLSNIQSYLTIWTLNIWLTFLVSILAFLQFVTYNHHVNINILSKNLLTVIVPFTVICILVSKKLSKKISHPLERLEKIIGKFSENENTSSSEFESNRNFIYEFRELENFIYKAFGTYRKNHALEVAFSKIAAQVAHDIKSPMTVLNNYFKKNFNKNDPDTLIVINTINTINDIAGNLLYQRKNLHEIDDNNCLYIEELSTIIDDIIEEKKFQYKYRTGTLKIDFIKPNELCFVQTNSQNLKRVISNIINNSEQSIMSEIDGQILVSIKIDFNKITLTIKDNGCGIDKDILLKISEGKTVSTQNGNGLGLPHAIKNIKEWNAQYLIESTLDIGTNFNIIFPLQEPPAWYCQRLYIGENTTIYIVDDDSYICESWEKKITTSVSKSNEYNIKYFDCPERIIEYVNKNNIDYRKSLFLIDLNFRNSNLSGLDVILDLSLENRAILVSNEYPNSSLKNFIETKNVQFMLKNYIDNTTIISILKNPDVVLLDDKQFVTKTWEISAKCNNKTIVTFNKKHLFMEYVEIFDKGTNIYLDSSLGDELGENIAKILYEIGFYNLHITTGYELDKFAHITWIKNIVGKEPPF